jgi:ribosome maturation factor RimP
MSIEEKIENLLQAKYAEPDYVDCFTIEIKVGAENTLEVFIDSEIALDFAKCQKVSRYLESFLDENKWLGEQYTLEVSSPGADRPLVFLRQYKKHIGRNLEITTEGNVYEGTFVSIDNEVITLEYEVKYKEGKKNIKKTESINIPFEKIEKAMVKFIF